MSRFFVPKDMVKAGKIVITGKEAHHILDVMRIKKADKVTTFDGSGREYVGIVKETDRRSLVVEIIETREPHQAGSVRITLIQALPKKEKIDYIVEKATELGVHRIIPVFTDRTIPDWDDKKKRLQAERWRKIATEAAKQCGRADIPVISEVEGFGQAVKMTDDEIRLIAVLGEETVPVANALSLSKPGSVTIAIGPEGDFTREEAGTAKEAGFKPVSLGPRVLKSDTAALAAIAIINYEFEN